MYRLDQFGEVGMVLDSLERYRVEVHGIPAALAGRGLALVEGLADSSDLLRLAESIGTVVPHRDSGADGVTTIADLGTERVQSGFAGFSACALNPHTDRSGVDHPPVLLMTSCGLPTATGGECVLIDGQAVYDDLAESEPDALRAFCAPRSVLFGGAAGYLGSIFTDADDGRIEVRLRLDDLAQFSPEVCRWLPTLRAAIDRHAMMIKLDMGQGYVLNNHRWLHGRRAFTGQRVIFRVNANPLPHLGIPFGFRPSPVAASSGMR
ncbi:TauD/TfdA family dioxygenase [Kibdelosporangium aridum]|nr:TauD/TfdA family dioxygenase [Kibdelosporangium aridum]